jgi:hypothetical protein
VPQTPPVARVLRPLIAVLVVAAVVATLVEVASRTGINPVNFFGFFTIQSNLILAAVYLLSALAPAALGEPTRSLVRPPQRPTSSSSGSCMRRCSPHSG